MIGFIDLASANLSNPVLTTVPLYANPRVRIMNACADGSLLVVDWNQNLYSYRTNNFGTDGYWTQNENARMNVVQFLSSSSLIYCFSNCCCFLNRIESGG
jgi:hypothetical protein